ncbi:MAG: DUF885 domain-containing protein [Desulfurococcales archaeon]|nr:DUF885 domain-containing protein [Desulfurococcales archaeon]MCE4605088.1 DUF885 domain-containing protein [Desulfurococcales archaeon]
MAGMVSLEVLRDWLREGVDDPSTIVDVKWVITGEKRGESGLEQITAIFPDLPIRVIIIGFQVEEMGDKLNLARMVVETPIDTISMDLKDRERVYRKLLSISRMPVVKSYLYGDDLNIAVAVDLNLRGLTKEEFNDSLAMLLAGVLHLYKELGMEETLNMELWRNLAILLSNYMQSGWTREQLTRFLVEKAGMSREEAEKIIDTLMGEGRKGMLYM